MNFWDSALTPPPPPPPPRAVPIYAMDEIIHILKVQRKLKRSGLLGLVIGVTVAFICLMLFSNHILYAVCCGAPVWLFVCFYLLEELFKPK